ncbi:MAG: hypothetical protein AAFQ82_27680, partial [Myxococcota bacterium]
HRVGVSIDPCRKGFSDRTLSRKERVSKAQNTRRLRPGPRSVAEPFAAWVDRYTHAVLGADGPKHLIAYSSAGVFGIEVARRLHSMGHAVRLALIDPLALEFRGRRHFGHWALRATYARPSLRASIALTAKLTRPYRMRRPRGLERWAWAAPTVKTDPLRDLEHLSSLSALLELNSGAPVTMSVEDLAWAKPARVFEVFVSRIQEHLPELGHQTLERIAIQYPIQVQAQHAYQLTTLPFPTLLLEPQSQYAGILALHLQALIPELEAHVVPLGAPTSRVQAITERFGALAPHYRSMRDQEFIRHAHDLIDRFL